MRDKAFRVTINSRDVSKCRKTGAICRDRNSLQRMKAIQQDYPDKWLYLTGLERKLRTILENGISLVRTNQIKETSVCRNVFLHGVVSSRLEDTREFGIGEDKAVICKTPR